MPEPTSPQIAKAKGVYRCSGMGQTKHCWPGEPLPVHKCPGSPVNCTWELRMEDNTPPGYAITVLIGHDGIFHTIEMDKFPEVDAHHNIRNVSGCGLETGEYRVTLAEKNFCWKGQVHFMIEAERVGNLSDELPIHKATHNERLKFI